MNARHLLGTGLVLAAVALGAIVLAPADALRAWLAASFLWSGVPIGSLGFMMIVRLVGGRWGYATYPLLEAGALTLPVSALSFLPVFVGMAAIYPWFGAAGSGFRHAWLSPLPFVARTLLLFAGLGLTLWALVARRGSAVAISSAGLLFMIPVLSLVLVDWIVSLDPLFHSSGFGLYAISIQFTLAWMVVTWLLQGRQPKQTPAIAALIITLILLYLYLAFTSYFIVWSGDLVTVVEWYKARGEGGWDIAYGASATIEVACFLALLFPGSRNSASWLRAIAAAMIVGKVVEAAWLVLPQAGPVRLGPVVLYLLAAAGLGSVMIGTLVLILQRRVAARSA